MRDDLDAHERHHAREDLVQRHVRRRHALQVERRHRHRRRQERRLQVHDTSRPKNSGSMLEVRQQRHEDRHEDHDDLGPLQRPAQDEDDGLRSIRNCSGVRFMPSTHSSTSLAAEQRERRREERRADEQPAHHRGRLGGEEHRLLDASGSSACRPARPSGSAPAAPTAAASVGVVMPNTIEPSTTRIRIAAARPTRAACAGSRTARRPSCQ